MSSTIVTQSFAYEKSRQGIEIRHYEEIFSTILPRILNNASPAVSENGKVPSLSKKIGKNSLFNDANSYDLNPVDRLENNREEFGRDIIEFVPNHVVEKRDFGIPSLFDNSIPYQDYINSDAIGYLNMQVAGNLPTLNYPYVLDLKNPIDPHSYDGVIETFTIRSWDTLQSEDKPISSRKVRGAISNYKEDQFGFCVPIEQNIYFYNQNFVTRPYLEYGDVGEKIISIKNGYFHDEIQEINPYDEKSLANKLQEHLDVEIANLISTSPQDNNTVGKKYISSATGYTFIDSQNGTDSIAFFDQRGY